MNTQLNKQIHALLNNTGLMPEKQNLVLGFSDGKSESSKDLSDAEAKEMINYLQSRKVPSPGGDLGEASNKMRRKIISLSYEMRWAKSPLSPEGGSKKWKAAVEVIDAFCKGPHGIFKKELNKHSYNELVQVVTQFQLMYKKYLNN